MRIEDLLEWIECDFPHSSFPIPQSSSLVNLTCRERLAFHKQTCNKADNNPYYRAAEHL